MLNLRFGRSICLNKRRLGFGISESLALAAGATAAEAASTAATVSTIGTVASVVSAGVGALGAIQQGNATANAAKYNSQVAAENAAIATQSANLAAKAGEAQAEQASMKTRATVGAIQANQAASGVDVNSGSSLDVRSSAQELGELNALTARSNAARTAYGYQTQSQSDIATSQLQNYEAETAGPAGDITGGATFLGGAANAATNYAKFLQAGGI